MKVTLFCTEIYIKYLPFIIFRFLQNKLRERTKKINNKAPFLYTM